MLCGQNFAYRKVTHISNYTDLPDLERLAGHSAKFGSPQHRVGPVIPFTMSLRGNERLGMRIYTAVSRADVTDLFQEAGFEVVAVAPGRDSRTLACDGPLPFEVTLHGQKNDEEAHTTFSAIACIAMPRSVSEQLAQSLQPKFPFCRVYVNGDGELVVGQLVYVGGGVTRARILELLDFWYSALERTHEAAAEAAAAKSPGGMH